MPYDENIPVERSPSLRDRMATAEKTLANMIEQMDQMNSALKALTREVGLEPR